MSLKMSVSFSFCSSFRTSKAFSSGTRVLLRKLSIKPEVHSSIKSVLSSLVPLVVFDGVVRRLHQQKQHDLEVRLLACQVQGCVPFVILEIFSGLEVEVVLREHPEDFQLVVGCSHMSSSIESYLS